MGLWWYRFCRFLFRVYFYLYHRGRVYNADRLPDKGAFILAGNHVSFLDPPFFGLACKREAFYMARDTLFRNPVSNWILRSWHCVPINRDKGDIGAMRTVLRMLGEGKAVLMFPEGTRSKDGSLQEARAGIGMIVAKANVPVVPMRIFGTERALPKGASFPRPARVEIKFGEPFTYPLPPGFAKLRGEALKAVYLDIGREIMKRIAELQAEPE
ncbi:MAG TPA: lysophospholipid acyltransferase family protein [Verrucomicrobiae bacterium]|nr:lysophospholipid acyltransferase family protein [Verrucomicrobiae bacterium]